MRRPGGSPDYFISVVEDIQRRKDAELALRAAEEQFHGLVDQSIAGIYIIQDGKFAYVNPRYVQIFGYDSADELLGREAVSLVAEKDRDRIAKQMRQRLEGEATRSAVGFSALCGSLHKAEQWTAAAVHLCGGISASAAILVYQEKLGYSCDL